LFIAFRKLFVATAAPFNRISDGQLTTQQYASLR
jgi:hypothetical protein